MATGGTIPLSNAAPKCQPDTRTPEVHNFEIVQSAAQNGVWQAAAWILERRFPARWGRRNPGDKSAVNISTDRVTVAPGGEKSAKVSNPRG